MNEQEQNDWAPVEPLPPIGESQRQEGRPMSRREREEDAYDRGYSEGKADVTDDQQIELRSLAGSFVHDALYRLYEVNDWDEAAVGEQMYEIEKGVRRSRPEVES